MCGRETLAFIMTCAQEESVRTVVAAALALNTQWLPGSTCSWITVQFSQSLIALYRASKFYFPFLMTNISVMRGRNDSEIVPQEK